MARPYGKKPAPKKSSLPETDRAKKPTADSSELNSLYQDILITVTNSFRDAEEFEALKEKVFPDIMKNRVPDAPIRVWAPG